MFPMTLVFFFIRGIMSGKNSFSVAPDPSAEPDDTFETSIFKGDLDSANGGGVVAL